MNIYSHLNVEKCVNGILNKRNNSSRHMYIHTQTYTHILYHILYNDHPYIMATGCGDHLVLMDTSPLPSDGTNVTMLGTHLHFPLILGTNVPFLLMLGTYAHFHLILGNNVPFPLMLGTNAPFPLILDSNVHLSLIFHALYSPLISTDTDFFFKFVNILYPLL